MTGVSDIVVDPEFAALIPLPSADERAQLERNIVAEGCREPLVTWKTERADGVVRVLLDGHNRLGICRSHDIEFATKDLAFDDRDSAKRWMLENQLGRRNLTPESVAYLRGKLYREEKKIVSNPAGANQHSEVEGNSCPQPTTADLLAERFKTSPRTIKNDAKFSEQLDELAEDLGAEFRQEVLSRDTKIARKEVAALAALPKKERKSVVEKLIAGEADSVRDAKKRELAADLNAKPLPQALGRFDVIVIDPPWQYDEHLTNPTHRGRNPYPDMSLDAIKAIEEEDVFRCTLNRQNASRKPRRWNVRSRWSAASKSKRASFRRSSRAERAPVAWSRRPPKTRGAKRLMRPWH